MGIKVKFTDSFFAEETTKRILKELFGNVIITDKPDYLFCSVDYKADRFNYDCPRIFLTGENIVPDFNTVDYAIGFHHMSFEDRYVRVPLYKFYEEDYELAYKKHLNCIGKEEIKNKKFCNFVYSNGSSAQKARDDFFYALSEYKHVDSGGRHLNNIGGPVDDKRKFQSNYKFSIAFENASSRGYLTEKLLQAFSAGTIPIYLGDPLVSSDFNTKAFINCHDFNSIDEVIEKVIEIDNDDELYMAMLREPAFTNSIEPGHQLDEYKEFLFNTCSQNPTSAIRRCNDAWGSKVQNEMRDFYKFTKKNEANNFKSKLLRLLIR